MIINIYVSSLASYSTMSLPFGGITGIHVNWGDGILTPATSTPPTHNYQHIGNYTIRLNDVARFWIFDAPKHNRISTRWKSCST
jgi:hypothetical protein